jgi:hypothetical protein
VPTDLEPASFMRRQDPILTDASSTWSTSCAACSESTLAGALEEFWQRARSRIVITWVKSRR